MASIEQKTPGAGADLTSLEVVRSDFRYEATLAPPAFDMLLSGKSFEPVYAALRPLGLRLEDMRVEGQQATEQALACYLHDWSTVVRYRFDRVEVQSVPQEVGIETLFHLIEVVMGVVRSVSQAKVDQHVFTAAVHAKLGTGTVSGLLARHASSTGSEKLTIVPSSVTFRVLSDDKVAGFITLEGSLSVTEAAFIRVLSLHPGTLSERAACDQALLFFRAANAALGLSVREERTDAGS